MASWSIWMLNGGLGWTPNHNAGKRFNCEQHHCLPPSKKTTWSVAWHGLAQHWNVCSYSVLNTFWALCIQGVMFISDPLLGTGRCNAVHGLVTLKSLMSLGHDSANIHKPVTNGVKIRQKYKPNKQCLTWVWAMVFWDWVLTEHFSLGKHFPLHWLSE